MIQAVLLTFDMEGRHWSIRGSSRVVTYFYTLEVLSRDAKGFVILYGMSVSGLRVETKS